MFSSQVRRLFRKMIGGGEGEGEGGGGAIEENENAVAFDDGEDCARGVLEAADPEDLSRLNEASVKLLKEARAGGDDTDEEDVPQRPPGVRASAMQLARSSRASTIQRVGASSAHRYEAGCSLRCPPV